MRREQQEKIPTDVAPGGTEASTLRQPMYNLATLRASNLLVVLLYISKRKKLGLLVNAL